MSNEQKVVPIVAEKWVAIKQSDAQAILNYLGGQPCAQVYNMVGVLLNLKEVQSPAPCANCADPKTTAEPAKES